MYVCMLEYISAYFSLQSGKSLESLGFCLSDKQGKEVGVGDNVENI